MADVQQQQVNTAAQSAALLSALDHHKSSSSSSGGGGGGGGASSGEAMTMDTLIKKAPDTALKNIFKWIGINPDIDGKGAIPQETNVGGQLALSSAALIKPESGGGWLSFIYDMLKKQTTRELPPGLGGGEGGGGGDYSGGGGGHGGGDYGGGGGTSGSNHGGGGDFHAHASHGGHHDAGEARVSYGDKMVAADALIGELGQLRPSATPVVDAGRDAGVAV